MRMKKASVEAFRRLQDFNRPIDERMSEHFSTSHQVIGSLHMSWKPPMDVFFSSGNLVIIMDIAGVSEQQLYLSCQDQRLVIRGIRQEPGRYPQREFHQLEVNFGPFQRSLTIPFKVNEEEIRARYRDGFLEIVIPMDQMDDRQVILELD